MKEGWFSEEQVIGLLKEVESGLALGRGLPEARDRRSDALTAGWGSAAGSKSANPSGCVRPLEDMTVV